MLKLLNIYVFKIFFYRFLFVFSLILFAFFSYCLSLHESVGFSSIFIQFIIDSRRFYGFILLISFVWGLTFVERKKIVDMIQFNGLSIRCLTFPIILFLVLTTLFFAILSYFVFPEVSKNFLDNKKSISSIYSVVIEGRDSCLFSSRYFCPGRRFEKVSLYFNMSLNHQVFIQSKEAYYYDHCIILENMDYFEIHFDELKKVIPFHSDGLVINPYFFPFVRPELQVKFSYLSYAQYRQLIEGHDHSFFCKYSICRYWGRLVTFLKFFVICLFLYLFFIFRRMNYQSLFFRFIFIVFFMTFFQKSAELLYYSLEKTYVIISFFPFLILIAIFIWLYFQKKTSYN